MSLTRFTFHSFQVDAFKNVGRSTCSVSGYPGLATRLASGGTNPLTGVTDTEDGSIYTVPLSTVTLRPGDTAGFYVSSVDGAAAQASAPASTCVYHIGDLLEATLPGDTNPVVAKRVPGWGSGRCGATAPADALEVSPVFWGTALPPALSGSP